VHVTKHVISSDGVSLHKNGTLLCDGEVIEFLSHHSHPGHASAGSIGNPVLYRAQGNLVLDELPLPSVDEGTMHGAEIQSTDGVAVARVAWVHVTTVDKMNGLGEGTTKELINQLRSWAGRQQGDVNSTSIQPAAGQYISLGHGILPGKNRHSVMLDDRPTNIPFSRAPGWRSDDVEPMLSSLNGTMAQCMTSVFPDMKRWCVADGVESDHGWWTQVCQYPRAPLGGLTFPSQQVVVRGHSSRDQPNASAADLHVDKMDGGGQFGGTILFLGGHERHPAQWRNFAIFEGVKGGRGVSIPVMHEDVICVLVSPYQRCLHGTVHEQQVEDAAASDEAVRIEGLHIVSYNLRMMEDFVTRVSTESAEKQATIVSEYLDERLRARANVWHMRRNNEEPLRTPRQTPPFLPKPPPQPPSPPVPSFYFKNSSTPADGDLQKYVDFARKTVSAAIPVVEKLKREREAAEGRDARAAKRHAGARGQAEHR
jgi:hypothetical protein